MYQSALFSSSVDSLQDYLCSHQVNAEIVDLGVPMKTAESAAIQLGVEVENILKSILLREKRKDQEDGLVLVVLAGGAQIDINVVSLTMNWNKKKVSFASAEVVLAKTGYPAGGTPPIGHREEIPVIVDSRIMTLNVGYGGGGLPNLLLRISPEEIVRVTQAKVAHVSKNKEEVQEHIEI